MANTAIVTSAEWIEGGATYTREFLNPKQKLALKVHALAIELNAIGGTDYTADYESLLNASETLAGFMNPDQICAAETAIFYGNAGNANSADQAVAAAASITVKLEAAKKLCEYDEVRLEKAKCFLMGSLGYHSTI